MGLEQRREISDIWSLTGLMGDGELEPLLPLKILVTRFH